MSRINSGDLKKKNDKRDLDKHHCLAEVKKTKRRSNDNFLRNVYPFILRIPSTHIVGYNASNSTKTIMKEVKGK